MRKYYEVSEAAEAWVHSLFFLGWPLLVAYLPVYLSPKQTLWSFVAAGIAAIMVFFDLMSGVFHKDPHSRPSWIISQKMGWIEGLIVGFEIFVDWIGIVGMVIIWVPVVLGLFNDWNRWLFAATAISTIRFVWKYPFTKRFDWL